MTARTGKMRWVFFSLVLKSCSSPSFCCASWFGFNSLSFVVYLLQAIAFVRFKSREFNCSVQLAYTIASPLNCKNTLSPNEGYLSIWLAIRVHIPDRSTPTIPHRTLPPTEDPTMPALSPYEFSPNDLGNTTSVTALIPHNAPYIKGGIGGRGNYRKNNDANLALPLTFETASGRSEQYYQQPIGSQSALPSGADKMKEKLVGLFKGGK